MCACACVCRYLQEVGSDASVSALLGHLFSQPCHLIWGLCDVFRALNQSSFVSTPAAHQPGHFCHQQSHALGCCYDVITLWRGRMGQRKRRVRVVWGTRQRRRGFGMMDEHLLEISGNMWHVSTCQRLSYTGKEELPATPAALTINVYSKNLCILARGLHQGV